MTVSLICIFLSSSPLLVKNMSSPYCTLVYWLKLSTTRSKARIGY